MIILFFPNFAISVQKRHKDFTVNPRISPLGAYLFLKFLEGGLLTICSPRVGAYSRGGPIRGFTVHHNIRGLLAHKRDICHILGSFKGIEIFHLVKHIWLLMRKPKLS